MVFPFPSCTTLTGVCDNNPFDFGGRPRFDATTVTKIKISPGTPIHFLAGKFSIVHWLKERRFFVTPEIRSFEIGVKLLLSVIIRQHLIALAAFFSQPEPPALSGLKVVLNFHPNDRTHAPEGIDHHNKERGHADPRSGIYWQSPIYWLRIPPLFSSRVP